MKDTDKSVMLNDPGGMKDTSPMCIWLSCDI